MKAGRSLQDEQALRLLIDKIGIARFEGRCAAGVIDRQAGAQAMQDYVSKESERPLVSRIAHFLSDSVEVYQR